MKKIYCLVILAAISALILTGCATRVSTLGVECYSEDPLHPCVVPPAEEDHTHGIAPAIGKNIESQSRPNTGASNPGNAPTVQDGGNANGYKAGAISNTSNFDIIVEISIGYLPGRINANQQVSLTGTYIPGYAPLTVTVPRKGYKEITLQPGDYDVRIYRTSNSYNGKKQIKNDYLHVDVTPGRNTLGSNNYHFVYYF